MRARQLQMPGLWFWPVMVGSLSTELTELFEVFRVEITEQVVDGVENG